MYAYAFTRVCILAHVAVTALLLSVCSVCARQDFLLEKVPTVARRTHSPRNIVAGSRIQLTDDTVEEEGDGEESDEDLDGM